MVASGVVIQEGRGKEEVHYMPFLLALAEKRRRREASPLPASLTSPAERQRQAGLPFYLYYTQREGNSSFLLL